MTARRPRLFLTLALAGALVLTGCGGNGADSGADPGGTEPEQVSSAGQELVVLTDDKRLQTVDNVVPVVNTKAVSPALTQALDKVTAALTTEDLISMNRQVDLERKTAQSVARAFAQDRQLTTGVTGGSGSVVVAAAGFTENQILGNLFAEALDAAGFDASVKPVTNREVYEPALERGEVQVAAEYVGTLTEFLNKKANGPDAPAKASGDLQATLAALRPLAQARGLTVLTPSQAADQNAFAVTKTFAEAHELTTLSDLAGYQGELVLGGPPECPTRPFCQPGLEDTYGITFTSFLSLDAGGPLTKTALQQGRVQVGLVFSSDGSLTPRT
ncbi:MAG: Glycine/betaine transporter substrate-binding protein [Frankiales bacterium]|jgi:osmoprotectant transport system substrate-binding protein|nr:Glycine/betaine transporter substrate-binding protein [Frankiales bacterium]